ncbi:hypothetical protein GWK48_02840 [Metallosphaera tengchongensis]|uniref:Uncharacterized protein n=1 Tax=Metallosphaera tengchongensis TaxID=1532350 RepID=A0A6N0NRY4_9CREN|nr:hypothetical protein [Metallosphaera tengchongensis]QKQ99471.1 hypothetical protein GWK48_02840 [Metallosphaera tengchongensis]
METPSGELDLTDLFSLHVLEPEGGKQGFNELVAVRMDGGFEIWNRGNINYSDGENLDCNSTFRKPRGRSELDNLKTRKFPTDRSSPLCPRAEWTKRIISKGNQGGSGQG